MKIAIISLYSALYRGGNYGTLFQNYALQAYLKNIGHEPFWVRTKSLSDIRYIKSIYNLYLYALDSTIALAKGAHKTRKPSGDSARPYETFFERHVDHTARVYTRNDLLNDPPAADIYIAGSDQIWTKMVPHFFLDFVPTSSRRIAYAASARWDGLTDEWLLAAREKLARFDQVSVREAAGVDVCRRAGREDTTLVLDPVFLMEKTHYIDLVRDEGDDTPYDSPFLMAYFVSLENPKELPVAFLERFSARQGWDLKADFISNAAQHMPRNRLMNPTPTQWLNAIDKSKFVLTNSFHGMAFAILMERPFAVLLKDGKRVGKNERITNMLRFLGLEDRAIGMDLFYSGDFDALADRLMAGIDWDEVRPKLQKWRDISREFLINATEAR